jgi:putative OPT family oligopeptide transporter
MTITTLLATGLLFAAMGESGDLARAGALTVGALVCIAASIAGDTSQDLKTGYLVGATPWKQQTGEILGVLTSAGVAVAVVLAIADRIGTPELPAPQATLMKLVVEGALDRNLPWGLILIGMGIGAVVELFRVPSLPFAVGVYLPFATMCTVFVGGCTRFLVLRRKRSDHPGILFGSGLIAGDAFVAIALALLIGFITDQAPELMHMAGPLSGFFSSPLFAMCVFGGLVWWLFKSK